MNHPCKLAFLAILASLVVGCASPPPIDEIPPLFGMIYDYDNRPVSGVKVSVGDIEAAQSDINGRFTLHSLAFGNYELGFFRAGYESMSVVFSYSDPAQVIYAKLISAEQLLVEAEQLLAERRWAEAEATIDRSAAVRPGHPTARYLKAVVKFRRGEIEDARSLLEVLLAEDYREPAIHLFLADIQQYKLHDAAKALLHLKQYLSLRYDPEIEQRLKDLTQSSEKHETLSSGE